MKKLLSLLCVLALLLGIAVSACADEVDFTKPLDIELMAYYVMDIPDDDPIMVYLENKFNVNFKLTITNIDNYNDTLNMRIASDDMPDWFRATDNSVYRQLAEDGMLIDVGEYVEKYNFENIRNTLNLPGANGLTVNNAFYCVPDTVGKLTPGVYYRADWLEELGLEVPQNYDEFKTVLEKIVEADPDGMGTTGFTLYDFGQIETNMLPGWLGYFEWGVQDDGSLIWKYEDEDYKAFIKYFADLYANKLLDQEMFVNSYETCMEKLASGRAGFYIMNLNTTWWGNNKAGLAQFDPEAKLGALVPCMEGPKGKFIGASFGFYANSAFNANLSEEKVARMLAIMDYLLSDEGRDLTLYGYEEGMYYDLIDGQKVQKEDVVNKAWGQSLHFMGEIADFGSNDRLARDPELIAWNEALDDANLTRLAKLNFFYDEEASRIGAEMWEIISAYRTAWLTGEKDIDATWNECQQKLKDAGLDRYREILANYVQENNIQLDKAL